MKKIISWYGKDNLFWVRVFGAGFYIKTGDLLFSERKGLGGFNILGLFVGLLKKEEVK